MYAPSASTATDPPYTNGHLSPPSANNEHARPVTSDSESALSEALDDPALLAPTAEKHPLQHNQKGDRYDSDGQSSQDKDAMGSDDPDFDMDSPAQPNGVSPRDARSTSQESPRSRKRKVGAENEDFMLNDPELYGLRRSVSRQEPSLPTELSRVLGPPSTNPPNGTVGPESARRSLLTHTH